MVLAFEISHPVKRRCIICNEMKFIPLNLKKPVCKECLFKSKNKLIIYGKLLLIFLLILLLIITISL